MASLRKNLSDTLSKCFEICGYDPQYGMVTVSNRPDLGQFQCNGPLAAAKKHKKNPREIASEILEALDKSEAPVNTTVAGPGFINISVEDSFLVRNVASMTDDRLGVEGTENPSTIVIDYGGANIAKPLHVGHLRSAILGEVLKRLARFLGHTVIGDVHLGDWGLQMGMVISEIRRRFPDLPYFVTAFAGSYPDQPPVTVEDLDEIYPTASARCKDDESAMEEARAITRELHEGKPGYRALWQQIHDISVIDLGEDYEKLNIEFDLWLGESDANCRIADLTSRLVDKSLAEKSQGALVMFVNEPDDKKELPPLILIKSDGAVLYGTTDLATIEQRMEEYSPDLVLYVVDKRQSDHFSQVFRAARKSGIAPVDKVVLEHLPFGTMNGKDGRPFKTRAGGVMKLKDLIQMLVEKALERMEEAEVAESYTPDEKQNIARMVGVAALKFGDLMNQPSKDYVFDLDRFASFEGKTGPYLLYTAVRIKSILRKASDQNLTIGPLADPTSDVERSVLLKLAALPDQLYAAHQQRAPHFLCDFVYDLSSSFSSFYRDHHILSEEDPTIQASWLGLAKLVLSTVELVADLLGIEIPDRM